MRKGLVFTLDAAFALFLTMVMLAMFVYLMESYSQQNVDMLELSRMARDVRMIEKYSGEKIPFALMDTMKMDSDCDSAKVVATSTGLGYGDIASGEWWTKSDVGISSNRVCLVE